MKVLLDSVDRCTGMLKNLHILYIVKPVNMATIRKGPPGLRERDRFKLYAIKAILLQIGSINPLTC